ncbi:Puromycin-sensitive aminopeptidase-like protein [Dinothrombium tinctorium]|uniref:Aminopeptidase n=1 Tax=Dinothrombium tinctorium TaxID=1965070 RepID=A0A3S4QEC0_9ACAR|nr:Puromycin-sensitive aminopeptidase-like protein [Dinothrombium tinctorium]
MPSQSQKQCELKTFARLPKMVLPRRYDLTLKPDLQKLVFHGNEIVDVVVNEATNEVILNAYDLTINSAAFKSEDGKVQNAEKFDVNAETEMATIKFASPLNIGAGQLILDFDGNLNDKMKGFYRSKYTTPEGEERFAATSQFEPTDARRAFPCWDEPAVKAKFDITLIVPKDKVALSNTNIISEQPYSEDQNYRVVKYATTPLMSTYLAAFIVGEYDYIEDTTENGVKVRVYTPIGKMEQGRFALDVAVKALPFYEKYFNIPYPLPKLDLIAIADFSAGAMENWGLVTYRETCLLVDPANTATIRKQHIAITVAHELAHQWFGNLVTMEWWTNLWLNEGFATFMEYLCVNSLFPKWDIWMQMVTDITAPALELDGLHNSHPIEVPIGHPSEIDEIFDDISYCKGASVIRMIHDYIGNECFSKGMSYYLNKHSYKNTISEDLWDALEEVSKKPIGNVMNTWTKQKGYPVITVSSRQEENNRILTLTQEKFCANGKQSESDTKALWLVPVTISTKSDLQSDYKRVLLDTKSTEIVLNNVSVNDWVKLNPGRYGFYRVNYSKDMLMQLLPAIEDKSLPPLDRLSIQSDLFALVQAGKVSTVEILKLLEASADEDNYPVWNSISSCTRELDILLSNTDYHDAFQTFCRKLFSKIHSKLGWDPIENESHFDTLLRALVIGKLVSFKEPTVLKEALKRFEAHANGTYLIPADVRAAIYRAAASTCDEKLFETMLSMYRKAEMHEEKNRILQSLGDVNDLTLIQKVLDFTLSSEVRSQDAVLGIIYVALNKKGRDPAWRFFQDNFNEFQRRYENGFLMSRLVKYVTENFASEEKANEVESFFAKQPCPGAERTVQQSLECIRLKTEWLNRDSETIKAYLTR